ncbi:Membrane-bound transcription factor site-2 protease-like [Oopsacas minuta]|uniref:Membrane-bound transcription factor site-2 protease n=1 Tax=Oopsacas minuta TaxID=111878 RepID=A0AAV7JT34_9METZ|nr:Membrane-bound transcription factor site-2 protease-like [Oopsacas minuta]
MFLNIAATVIGFWLFLNILDQLANYFSDKYRSLRETQQFTVTYGYFKLYSTHFNGLFSRLRKIFGPFLSPWFAFGSFLGCSFMILSVLLLSFVIASELTIEQPTQLLTPIVPGVNLPYHQLILYLVAILISAIFHEAGHGLAAVNENVKVNGVGVFCFIIYPAAFVDLCSEDLSTLTPRKRLRIYCAGICHNFILAVIAVIFLILAPYILSLFYSVSSGIYVMSVDTNSVLHNKVFPSDIIMQLNGCQTLSNSDYISCLREIITISQPGYCVDQSYIDEHEEIGEHSEDCCKDNIDSDLCFRIDGYVPPYRCMHARIVSQKQQCNSNTDCESTSKCSVPVLPEEDRLIRISLLGIAPSQDTLYLGTGYDLFYILSTSNYIPKSELCIPELPTFVETFLSMIVSISGALALLNSVPCYYLDGYWIFDTFLDAYCPFMFNKYNYRQMFCKIVYFSSTALLVVNLLLAIVKMALRS